MFLITYADVSSSRCLDRELFRKSVGERLEPRCHGEHWKRRPVLFDSASGHALLVSSNVFGDRLSTPAASRVGPSRSGLRRSIARSVSIRRTDQTPSYSLRVVTRVFRAPRSSSPKSMKRARRAPTLRKGPRARLAAPRPGESRAAAQANEQAWRRPEAAHPTPARNPTVVSPARDSAHSLERLRQFHVASSSFPRYNSFAMRSSPPGSSRVLSDESTIRKSWRAAAFG